MKKILLVTIDFPPSKGGVARFYHELVTHLPKESIVVLAPQIDSAPWGQTKNASYTLVRKKLFFRKLLWPRWLPLLWHIWRVARHENIEHIFVGQILPVGTAVWILSFFWSIPYTVITHAMDVLLPRMYPRKKLLLRRILGRAKSVSTVSSFTRKELVDSGVPTEKIFLISPGVSRIPKSDRDIRQEIGWENNFILLTISRLVERKGHEEVLRALLQLKESLPNIRYLVVGAGPFESRLKDISKQEGLEDFVHFAGEVSDKDLGAYYAACNVFIMLSRQIGGADVEGFGIVFLEAALFSKPSIAGKTGGVADAVVDGHTGLLVNPEKFEEVSQAILKLSHDPRLREELGQNAYTRVQEHFSWQSQAKKFERLV